MPKQYTDCWAHKQKLSYMQGNPKAYNTKL